MFNVEQQKLKKMKIISKTIKLLPLFLMALAITSCSDDDDNNGGTIPPVELNIVETALGDPELASLVAAVTRAGLGDALQADGPLTVLAPTNAAFTAFLSDNGFASLEDVPVPLLTQVLLNHVIADEVRAADLVAAGSGYGPGLATNDQDLNISIYFNTSNGVRFNNAASVTAEGADIDASNGVIHKIDAVLGLPDVVDFAIANPDLSSLVAALGAADGGLVGVLQGDGPFTVLAPTNTAFGDFLDDTPLGSVDTAVLSQILLNHVIGASVTSGALVEGGANYTNTSATGAGGNAMSLYYNTTDGVTFNGVSTVIEGGADIVGTNGVIHIVGGVIDIPTVVTFATADPNFSTLVTALTDDTPGTDFVEILSRTEAGSPIDGINPNYTVFAPTNTAFAALAEIPGETVLTQILLHHVIAEANIASGDITDGVSPTMLNGQTITINLPGTGDNIADVTDAAGNTDIGIIAVDVQAGNGVIHVLNKVMIPASE
jgi:uncharacterized surface protein with fasciclin (FAS1) repeats